MGQMLVVGARLFAANIGPAAARAPAPAHNSFSLGLVLGDPRRLGEHKHRALEAHIRFSPAIAATASRVTDRGAPDLWSFLRSTLSAPLRLCIGLDLGACYRL
jgi:hypothetical protein